MTHLYGRDFKPFVTNGFWCGFDIHQNAQEKFNKNNG